MAQLFSLRAILTVAGNHRNGNLQLVPVGEELATAREELRAEALRDGALERHLIATAGDLMGVRQMSGYRRDCIETSPSVAAACE